jgi:hypothetical protein
MLNMHIPEMSQNAMNTESGLMAQLVFRPLPDKLLQEVSRVSSSGSKYMREFSIV